MDYKEYIENSKNESFDLSENYVIKLFPKNE